MATVSFYLFYPRFGQIKGNLSRVLAALSGVRAEVALR